MTHKIPTGENMFREPLNIRQLKTASKYALYEDDNRYYFEESGKVWIEKDTGRWGFKYRDEIAGVKRQDAIGKTKARAILTPILKKIWTETKPYVLTIKKAGGKKVKDYVLLDKWGNPNYDPIVTVAIWIKEHDNFAGNYTVEINGKELNMYILKIIVRSGTLRETQHLYDCLRAEIDCFKIPIFGNKGSDILFYDDLKRKKGDKIK